MASSSGSKVHINISGLDQLMKNIEEAKRYHIKIGILSDGKVERTGGELNNAQIGNFHEQEFGSISKKIPQRSFLKMPLEYEGQSITFYLHKNSESIMKDLTADKGIKRLYYKVGMRAKTIIKDAFESGGFGQWQPLAQSTIDKKGSDKILVDTGQLENAITFRCDKGSI